MPVELAVIVPAYNEAESIAETVTLLRETLATLACVSEILVVDDGSTDGTGAAAERAGARVLSHGGNLGYGAALKTGVLHTGAPVLTIIDADGSYLPSAIPGLFAKIAHADMVVGARRLSSPGVTWIRRPGKWALNRFAGYLTGRHIPDVNSGQRVMRRDAVLRYFHLLPNGFSFTTTITLALLSNGHNVLWEPIEYHTRVGRSKLRASNFGGFLLLVVRATVLFNPLKVFLPMGGVVFVAGAIALVHGLFAGHVSVAAVVALSSAVVVWAIGLFADMIARLEIEPPWRR